MSCRVALSVAAILVLGLLVPGCRKKVSVDAPEPAPSPPANPQYVYVQGPPPAQVTPIYSMRAWLKSTPRI